LLTKI
jgi:hypothetical protein